MRRRTTQASATDAEATGTPAFEAIDQLVHEPARLAMMAHLYVLEYADFIYLLNETGLTRGNLSSHMSRLEEAGYITVAKTFEGKTPRTILALSEQGRAALRSYRRTMEGILATLDE